MGSTKIEIFNFFLFIDKLNLNNSIIILKMFLVGWKCNYKKIFIKEYIRININLLYKEDKQNNVIFQNLCNLVSFSMYIFPKFIFITLS